MIQNKKILNLFRFIIIFLIFDSCNNCQHKRYRYTTSDKIRVTKERKEQQERDQAEQQERDQAEQQERDQAKQQERDQAEQQERDQQETPEAIQTLKDIKNLFHQAEQQERDQQETPEAIQTLKDIKNLFHQAEQQERDQQETPEAIQTLKDIKNLFHQAEQQERDQAEQQERDQQALTTQVIETENLENRIPLMQQEASTSRSNHNESNKSFEFLDSKIENLDWVHPTVKNHKNGPAAGGNSISIFNIYKLATVVHELYDYARTQGFNFERGSFSIVDKDKKFFNAFKKSAELLGSRFYERNPDNGLSSHYKDSPGQYGVDMRDDQSLFLNILPGDYHHILFGDVKKGENNRATFLKCEPYGLSGLDIFDHAYAYVSSIFFPPDNQTTKREKDLPPEIKETFDSLLKKYPFFQEKLSKERKVQVFDIDTIIKSCKEAWSNKQNKDNQKAYEDIVYSLSKSIINYKHNDLRHFASGNEVVIPQNVTDKLIPILEKELSY